MTTDAASVRKIKEKITSNISVDFSLTCILLIRVRLGYSDIRHSYLTASTAYHLQSRVVNFPEI